MELWLELIPAAGWLIEYDLGNGEKRREFVENEPSELPENAEAYELVTRIQVDNAYSEFDRYREE